MPIQATAWSESAPPANTTAGKIRGTIENGVNAFKGVAYGGDTANPRFTAPVPAAPWKDVLKHVAPQLAVRSGGAAPQGAPNAGAQSEDCLHLNVWTGGLRDGRRRPVVVYFHGGAYNKGTVNSDL